MVSICTRRGEKFSSAKKSSRRLDCSLKIHRLFYLGRTQVEELANKVEVGAIGIEGSTNHARCYSCTRHYRIAHSKSGVYQYAAGYVPPISQLCPIRVRNFRQAVLYLRKPPLTIYGVLKGGIPNLVCDIYDYSAAVSIYPAMTKRMIGLQPNASAEVGLAHHVHWNL